MNRITSGKCSLKKLKKIFKKTKGYKKKVDEQLRQGLYKSYINRKLKKRIFRQLWILHITSGSNTIKTNYSFFLGKMRKKNVFLNRKMLSTIIYKDFNNFNFLFKKIKLLFF